MSDNRKKLSGAGFRKRALQKKKETDDLLLKTPKLESFFSKKDSSDNLDKQQNCDESLSNQANVEVESQPAIDANIEVESQPAIKANIEVESQPAIEANIEVESQPAIEANIEVESQPVIEANVESDNENLFEKDPAKWHVNEFFRDYIALNGCSQNISDEFPSSKRIYSDVSRYCSPAIFQRTTLNGEKTPRSWLIYSESKCAVFCGPCLLFGGDSSAFTKDGFNDWKNSNRVALHENTTNHKQCVLNLKSRLEVVGRIDNVLVTQANEEIVYWKNVLKRVIAVIKALASRGLSFRGHEERFGSANNGNYLMALELIAEFDPFLASHINKFGNKGRGVTNYLSKTVCEEFIELLADKVRTVIIDEIKAAKYYSIIVDSSPDISHADQLTLIIRYVQNDGVPKERFIKFIENVGHEGEEITKAVLTALESYGLDINNCRGQSFDNAPNMTGIYKGVQTRIQEINSYANFVPCAAHSLNLVGTNAVKCCLDAVSFFAVVQKLYNFFSSSPHRWNILQSCAQSTISLKTLSKTRWSAHGDAVRVLCEHLPNICKALEAIENDSKEKGEVRCEAQGIRNKLETFETSFLLCVWNFVLKKINAVSTILQDVKTNLGKVVELYDGLISIIQATRDEFDLYEKKALEISVIQEYKTVSSRKRTRALHFGETRDEETSGRDNFRISTFNVILDQLICDLKLRSVSYVKALEKFGGLIDMATLGNNELREKAETLRKSFPEDLEISLSDELIQFKSYCAEKALTQNLPQDLLQILRRNDLCTLFPNVDIACTIYVCTPISNSTAERSFSVLKRVKNYLRSTMGESRLSALAILTIENDILLN